MARRGRSPKTRNLSKQPTSIEELEQRDGPTIANTWDLPPVPVLPVPDIFIPPRSSPLLRQVEDRRTWNPQRIRPAASLRRPNHLLSVGHYPNAKPRSGQVHLGRVAHPGLRTGSTKTARPGWAGPPYSIRFHQPKWVIVCMRRETRREVLFAKSKGRSPKVKRQKRRNAMSNISCRRT